MEAPSMWLLLAVSVSQHHAYDRKRTTRGGRDELEHFCVKALPLRAFGHHGGEPLLYLQCAGGRLRMHGNLTRQYVSAGALRRWYCRIPAHKTNKGRGE